jgi:hypothetical protein
MRFGPLFRHYINQGTNRIKHWNPCKRTRYNAADGPQATPIVGREVAPANQTDTYQKRQYRLDVRRYVREGREGQCARCLEVITLIVVAAYAAVTFWLAVIAREQLTYSERPWVGPGTIDITTKPTADQSLIVHVAIVNSGKSPALHVSPRGILKLIILPRGDLRVPFIHDPGIVDCAKPVPTWSDDLGGSIVLPGSINQQLDLKSPP